MDIEKICIANLGKEIMYGRFKGMIVGYDTILKYLIISFLILNIIKDNLSYE